MEVSDLEVVELRRRVARLKEEARKNEDAWKRAQAREMELLEADKLVDLLAQITGGMRHGYQLEAVTLILVDHDHEIRHLLMSQGENPEQLLGVHFVDSLNTTVPEVVRNRPWLGGFAEADHSRLFPQQTNLRSVALLPLARQRRVFGCLNMGSSNPSRFTQGHATDFLHHLSVIAAFSLENTVNRARLLRSGFTDALTGWHNRRYLKARLKEEISRSIRERSSLLCLMIDIDHFKRINDTYGHIAGDEVLSRVAQCISNQVRSSDVSARFGGEEFVILLPGTEAQAGHALAERIRRAVSAATFELEASSEPLSVTVSIGVAEHRPEPASEPAEQEVGNGKAPNAEAVGEQLIAKADRALYTAKAQGRNLVALANNG